MQAKLADLDLQRIRALVAQTMGLAYPSSHFADLQRGIFATAKELGFEDAVEFAHGLAVGPSTKKELQILANHLTVGETYFFREKRSFEILARQILPSLVANRRQGERHLRIWSAACCTGEEAYSIAIVLSQVVPDWQEWNITLLATDINSRFLRKAVSGVFGQWSFRNAPPWLLQRYFRPAGEGRFEIVPEIKSLVRFAHLNLADDVYPSPQNDTNGIDVIFCRNVLMYFTERQARQVLQRFNRAQSEGGWLIIGPNELPKMSGIPYAATNFQGTILYQKNSHAPQHPPLPVEAIEIAPVEMDEAPPQAAGAAKELEHQSSTVDTPEPSQSDASPQSSALRDSAHSLANQGKLSEALECCDQWIAADRFDSSAHYLRAMISQERGELDDAVRALRTALYLDPNYLLAHFALGNIARRRHNSQEAARHLQNARKLLRRYRPDDLIPEFEGVTAGRFVEVVDSLIEMETVA
jgi:chemotaxis protein methyltransferase CheR